MGYLKMPTQPKVFRYKRQLLLSALYDSFDELGWTLKSARSEAGILAVVDRRTGAQMVIRVTPAGDAGDFAVSLEGIGSNTENDRYDLLAERLFAVLEDMLENAVGERQLEV
jgi:hypothetical protein